MKTYLEIKVPIKYDDPWFIKLRSHFAGMPIRWQKDFYHITMVFINNTPKGIDMRPLLEKHLATAQAPVWTQIGGLTDNSLSFSAEASAQQTKDSGMWPNAAITSKSYEVNAEVIMLRDNEAQEAIEQFMVDDDISNAKKLLNIAIVDLDSKEYYDLTVAPTAWEITAESEDMITKSFTATGSGAPEKKTGFVVP